MSSLYIENLPIDTTETDLRTLFHPFGSITRADVWYGWCLGPGFWVGAVDLESGGPEAVAAFDGTVYRSHILDVRELNVVTRR